MNWGKFVRAKQNIAEVLAKELRKKPRGTVGVSTICDPYQSLEAKLELTRKCIELLSKRGFDVCIQTKSNLVLRDKDVIKPGGFEVGVTITTMDTELASELEPHASPPDARAQVLEEFSTRGVATWIFLGPIISDINDSEENIRRVVEVAQRTNSRLIYDRLNLRRWVLDRLTPVLEKKRPGPVKRYPSFSRDPENWRRVCSKVESVCRELGVKCEPAFPR